MQIAITNARMTEVFQNAKEHGTRGYNCWGATMYLLGATPELRWVEEPEIRRYVNSDKFERVSNPLELGDVLVVQEAGGRLIHTALYVGNERFLHKKGSNTSELATFQQVRETYPDGIVRYLRHKPIKLTLTSQGAV